VHCLKIAAFQKIIRTDVFIFKFICILKRVENICWMDSVFFSNLQCLSESFYRTTFLWNFFIAFSYATLPLVYSTAEYCAPACCRSANTSPIDPVINGALRNVTGCMSPETPENLSTLASIQPAEDRRKGTTQYL